MRYSPDFNLSQYTTDYKIVPPQKPTDYPIPVPDRASENPMVAPPSITQNPQLDLPQNIGEGMNFDQTSPADDLLLRIQKIKNKKDERSVNYIADSMLESQRRSQTVEAKLHALEQTMMAPPPQMNTHPQFSTPQLYAQGINALLGGNIGNAAGYFGQQNQQRAQMDYTNAANAYNHQQDVVGMQYHGLQSQAQDERNYQQQLGGMQIQEYGRQRQNDLDLLKEARGRFYSANTLGEKIQAMSDMGMQPGSPVWNAEIQKFNSEDEKKQRAAVGDDVKDFYKYTDQFKPYGGIPDAAMPHAVALWQAMKQKWGDRWNVPDPSSLQGLKTVAQQNADTTKTRTENAIELGWYTLGEKAREFDQTLPLKMRALDISEANLGVAQANLGLRGIGMAQGEAWKQYQAARQGITPKDIAAMVTISGNFEKGMKAIEKEIVKNGGIPTEQQLKTYSALKENLKAIRERITDLSTSGFSAMPTGNGTDPVKVNPPSDMSGPIGDTVARGMSGGQRSTPKKGGGSSKGVSGSYNYKGAKVTVRGG